MTKTNYTQLELTFMNEHKAKFEEFINFTTLRAGATIDPEMVQMMIDDKFTKYIITGSPFDLYMIGYDWALWQFPPNK